MSTNAISTLLNPARAEGESQAKYRERRTAGQDYVASSLQGTLFWNTNLRGAYFNEARASRPVGKSGHRKAKAIARIARAKIASGELTLA
jgi:hypothetical protein